MYNISRLIPAGYMCYCFKENKNEKYSGIRSTCSLQVRRVCWQSDVGRNASIATYLHGCRSKYSLIIIDVQVLTETHLHIHRVHKHTHTCVMICINLW